MEYYSPPLPLEVAETCPDLVKERCIERGISDRAFRTVGYSLRCASWFVLLAQLFSVMFRRSMLSLSQ